MTIVTRMTEMRDLSRKNPRRSTAESALSLGAYLSFLGEKLLNAIAPIGYEDEQGFHYGEQIEPRDRSR